MALGACQLRVTTESKNPLSCKSRALAAPRPRFAFSPTRGERPPRNIAVPSPSPPRRGRKRFLGLSPSLSPRNRKRGGSCSRLASLSDTHPAKITQSAQSPTPIFTAGFRAPPTGRILPSPRRIRAAPRRTGRGGGSGGWDVDPIQAIAGNCREHYVTPGDETAELALPPAPGQCHSGQSLWHRKRHRPRG